MKSQKEKIDGIIKLKRENTLWNHILTSLFHKGKTIAEKKRNEYIIWTSNKWTGGFYPIFKIGFNENKEISKIETELSPYGKLCFLLLGLSIFSFTAYLIIIPMIINYKEVNINFLIPIVLFSLLFYGVYIVMRKIYYQEKKYLIDDLKIIVGIETPENLERKELEKNEWSLNMILFRLFAYPFSLFLIIISVYALSSGKFLRSGLGIVLGIGFLYSDIKTILQKRKITKANTS